MSYELVEEEPEGGGGVGEALRGRRLGSRLLADAEEWTPLVRRGSGARMSDAANGA